MSVDQPGGDEQARGIDHAQPLGGWRRTLSNSTDTAGPNDNKSVFEALPRSGQDRSAAKHEIGRRFGRIDFDRGVPAALGVLA
jgi:hypothetical protein